MKTPHTTESKNKCWRDKIIRKKKEYYKIRKQKRETLRTVDKET
jgi:hypothetical protein